LLSFPFVFLSFIFQSNNQEKRVKPSEIDRNMRVLVLEIFWAGIHSACLSFNAAFLIRLGGSNLHVSLLSAGAALVIAVTTIPFAALMDRTRRRRTWIVGSLLTARLLYALMIFVPWLPAGRASVMVGVVLGLNIAASLFSAGWLPLMGEVVPLARRARLFATRNIVLGATVSIATLLLGRWLELAPFPMNYQMLYGLSVFTSMVSTWYVAQVNMPELPLADPQAVKKTQPRTMPRPFVNITTNTLVFNVALWMSVPLQPIYFVRELGAAEGWLGLWAGLVSGGAILGNLLWQRLIDRRGAAWTLPRATVLSAIYFLLIALFPDLTLILVFALLSGIVTPGVELSHLTMLYTVVPLSRRTALLGIYTALMNCGAFLSPLLVGPLVELWGARVAVLAVFAIRLAGAALFVLNPVRASSEPTPGLEAA
jgi:MFS family permease